MCVAGDGRYNTLLLASFPGHSENEATLVQAKPFYTSRQLDNKQPFGVSEPLGFRSTLSRPTALARFTKFKMMYIQETNAII